MDPETIRKEIFSLVSEYYREKHQKNDFIPGEAYMPYSGRIYDENELILATDAVLDFWLTSGRYVRKFEDLFSGYLGSKNTILTNSGSSANLLAISALSSSKLGKRKICQGDEVITLACGFPTTVTPIIQNGFVPAFVDVELGTYNVDLDRLQEAVSDKTRAVIFAHTLGNPFDAKAVREICDDNNLWFIEDNCDALGSKYNGRYTGTYGDIGTFSFYPAHHITMGEGGALITDDTLLKRIIVSFRDWGRDCWCESGCDNSCGKRFDWQLGSLPKGYDHKYIYSHLGYNLKITEMQAAIGVAQMDKLDSFIAARKRNFDVLYNALKRFDEYFLLPEFDGFAEPSWFGFPVTVKKDAGFSRDDIVQFLENKKIATRMLFAGNLTRHPCMDGIKYRIAGELTNSDTVMNDTYWTGVYPGIGKPETDYIIDTYFDFFSERGIY